MERKIEIPDFREDEDEATMENNADPAVAPTLSSSGGSEEWEKISEDWVSLFLDPALLDDQSRPLPIESYSQFDTTLPETNDHFSSQDLLADSLVLGSSSIVVENLFAKEGLSGEVDPKREPLGGQHTGCAATSSTSSLTQLSGGSSSGMVEDKEGKHPDLSTTLKRELNGEVSSGSESPTFPSTGGEACSPSNQLQSSSCLLQCKEGETGSVGHEAVSSTARVGTTPSTASRHLQSIGNAIKVGLLGRSGDNKPEICEAESFGLANQEVPEDQQSDHSDADRKGEGGDEDDEKRRARLMRNRESAQLSRQRKKVYVDELEGKLRTMTATIVELNATISHLTAENVNLRRQLGYYYPAPGACPPRPGMPMHVLPMGPYPGMVAGRPMYPGGQMPPVPIPRIKAQAPARSAKRAKPGTATKEGGDKKRTKLKAAGAASMAVMGLLCVAMLFGSFDQSLNDSNGVGVVGNVRVGGRVLTSWNEGPNNALNSTGFSKWEYGPGWAPLAPGEYGPEQEGVPSVHTRVAAEQLAALEAEKAGIPTSNGFESSVRNATLATSTSPDCFSSVKAPVLIGSEVIPANTSLQSFAASVFIPGADGLVKVDGNLIIQAVMAGDKAAAKKQSEKKRKSGLKNKKKEKKQQHVSVERQAVNKHLPVKALDKLASRESKVLKNASTGPFVTARLLSGNVSSVVGSNNPVSPVIRAGALQQWMLGGLHGPVLNTGMCTELFQFDTATTAPGQASSSEAQTMAESVAAKAAQGGTTSAQNVTSPFTVPVVPRSRRDPFAVPLPPMQPRPEERRSNGTDPREPMHKQNLRHGVSSMVVSVLAGPEDYGDSSRRKGGAAKGLSRIFVVVLVDNQKYVTYSCMLPSAGPQAHVVAE